MKCKACNAHLSDAETMRTYPTGEHVDLCMSCYSASYEAIAQDRYNYEVLVDATPTPLLNDGDAWSIFLVHHALLARWSDGLWGVSAERALRIEEERYALFLGLRGDGVPQCAAMERAAGFI
jgi:hypothetical protein